MFKNLAGPGSSDCHELEPGSEFAPKPGVCALIQGDGAGDTSNSLSGSPSESSMSETACRAFFIASFLSIPSVTAAGRSGQVAVKRPSPSCRRTMR